MRVVIIGAGLAGLSAAHHCVENGHEVVVFDKGRGVGGRLATRRIGDAVLDHGAQFFTARDERFQSVVNSWMQQGVVHEWCRGFDSEDGHPRYVGANGMTSIAKHMAKDIDVRCSTLVFSLAQHDSHWDVTTDDGVVHTADRVILTAPLPQSFSLMFSGGIEMPADLRTIDYDRTLGLLAILDSNTHNVSAPGGMQNPDDVFSFIGDNSAKRISTAPALTFHANPAWSLKHFDLATDEIHELLLTAAAPWLGTAKIIESQPKKWRFATPQRVWPDACWTDPSSTLALGGDAFAGPRCEGAFLSGLAAATAILS